MAQQGAHHQPTVCAITNSSNTVPLMTSQLTRFSSGMYSRQSLPYARSCRSCPSSGNRCYNEGADGMLSCSHTAIEHGTTCLQVAVALTWISTLLCKVRKACWAELKATRDVHQALTLRNWRA